MYLCTILYDFIVVRTIFERTSKKLKFELVKRHFRWEIFFYLGKFAIASKCWGSNSEVLALKGEQASLTPYQLFKLNITIRVFPVKILHFRFTSFNENLVWDTSCQKPEENRLRLTNCTSGDFFFQTYHSENAFNVL